MWWGVAAALFANVLYSGGFVVEKRASTGLPALTAGRPLRTIGLLPRSPPWLVGSLALTAGFAARLAVHRALPLAAAQGILVAGPVLLLLSSSVVPGERPSARERAGVLAVLVAPAMVVGSLRSSDTVGDHAPAGRLPAVCPPALVGSAWLYTAAGRRARDPDRPPATGVEYGVALGLLYGVSSPAIKGVSGREDARPRRPDGGTAPLALPVPAGRYRRGRSGVVPDRAATVPGVADRAGVHHGVRAVHRRARQCRLRRGAATRSGAAGPARGRHGPRRRRPARSAPARPSPRPGRGVARWNPTIRCSGSWPARWTRGR
ncbi:hypothetical protein EHYA_02704 [Embleya hyalina]|uniref:Uncharacterized protein n=1 Tax=Embleya hyalina TaxID=516124 RepID=A0A401YKA4_9ACTN|nr:hypothetical protein EHYA_02704 [Embleya hyalina]